MHASCTHIIRHITLAPGAWRRGQKDPPPPGQRRDTFGVAVAVMGVCVRGGGYLGKQQGATYPNKCALVRTLRLVHDGAVGRVPLGHHGVAHGQAQEKLLQVGQGHAEGGSVCGAGKHRLQFWGTE
jgi:hypothetical protein